MRKLFAIILSLSLIVNPVAIAEESSGDKPGGSAFYMNQVLSIGTSVIGSSILTSCSLSNGAPSLMAFMAGSVVYIASEIMGANAQKAFLQAKTKEIEDLEKQLQAGGGDLQREIIEAKLKEEQDKLEFVKKRKMWSMAVMAVYMVATGLAAWEWFCSTPTPISMCPQWLTGNCVPGATVATDTLLGKAIIAAYGYGAGMAGGGGMLTSIAGLAGALLPAITSLGSMVKVAYDQPMARVITFGAASALVTMVVMGLSETQKKLEENISKLQAMLTQFNSQTTDLAGVGVTAGASGGTTSGTTPTDTQKYDVTALPTGTLPKTCVSQSATSGITVGESSCANPLKLNKPAFHANMNLPTLMSAGNMATDMGNAVARGDTARADVLAGQLGNAAARIRQSRDNVIKQINDKLKAAGKKPLDFDGEVKKQIAAMGNAVNQQMGGAGNSMASLGGGSNTATLDPSKSVKSDAAGVPSEVKAGSSEKSLNIGGAGISEGNLTEGLPLETAATPTPESLDNFEINVKDVSEKKEDSIFKQLSNRYLLNYTKFFEKKKVEEVPAQ